MPAKYLFTPLKYRLKFKFVARTSQGCLPKYRKVYYIKVESVEKPHIFGIGECSPFPSLSIDDTKNFETNLKKYCRQLSQSENPEDLSTIDKIQELPSVVFALETALLDLQNGGKRCIYKNQFSQSKQNIPINGLIWMGNKKFMFDQIKQKISEGYRVIKIKIGGIAFGEECELISFIRKKFSIRDITIRVDANGAFKPEEAMQKLDVLSQYHIHSVEQPIGVGQWEAMAQLCKSVPIDIALDEELIGIYDKTEKDELLTAIQPQYVVLKPTLLGGLKASADWIEIAQKKNIGWWLTSALESNIGLNAIAQFSSQYKKLLPQGLGTGKLYENNLNSPLFIKQGSLHTNPQRNWQGFDMLKALH